MKKIFFTSNTKHYYKDNDTTYDMETLYAGGMEKFVQYYNEIKFKCTKIDYHKSNGKVKYLFIEQITQ